MTVKELIEELKLRDPKQPVYFAHPSHDFWRSELASEVETMDEERIKFSDYHSQMTTFKRDDRDNDGDIRDEEPEDGTLDVLLLR